MPTALFPNHITHLTATELQLKSLRMTASVGFSTSSSCRFVTKADVEKLGLTHLLGTSLMRAYMHGYFVDNRLWHKAKALAEPFAYDSYRQQRVQQKIDQERKSRIGIVKKLPKVGWPTSHPQPCHAVTCCHRSCRILFCTLPIIAAGSSVCRRTQTRRASYALALSRTC